MVDPLRFPDGFLWGTSTSPHQVEGDNRLNDWWRWEQEPGRIHDGTTSGRAAEWWAGRAEEDLARAAELGQNAHRLGVEWSRLEPEPGRFDATAFDRYAEILTAARGLGMRVFVCLHHFTLPVWAARRGWLDGDLPVHFERFARECARRLGEHVDAWATMNEPSVLAFMGYAQRSWPPGEGNVLAYQRALRNLVRAHHRAYRAVHAERAGARVGIILNAPVFDPARPGRRRDELAAAAQDWAFNGALLRALARRRTFDFLGLNYYGRYRVRFDPRAAATLMGRHVQDGNIRTEHVDWGEPSPDGLTRQLLRFAQLRVPLYVTENGVFDNEDRIRPGFLVDHIRAVHTACLRGADVRGYFHWSLVDNFEWTEGWSTHFGLIALDRDTQARTPRGSAELYARICRANALDVSLGTVPNETS